MLEWTWSTFYDFNAQTYGNSIILLWFSSEESFNCFPFLRVNLTLIICLSSLFMVLISFSFDGAIRLTILPTHVNSFLRLPFGWLTLSKCARNIESNQFRAIQAVVSDRAKLSRMIRRMRNFKSHSQFVQTIVECSLWNWKIIWRMIKKPLSSSRGEAHTKSNFFCQRVQWLVVVCGNVMMGMNGQKNVWASS